MGPLTGKRIIEIAGIGPGPVAGMMFADMGAEVILIERKPATGVSRTLPDPKFTIMNRGKRSVAVDLKAEGATGLVLRLMHGADALIEGFRPGVMERLGLGPDVCFDANPRLVYGRMTGWGQTGPLASAAGHDINYISLSGAIWYGGRPDSPPSAPPTLVGDFGAGATLLVIGVLAAMVHAERTGEGQVVDAAITDGSALATTLLQAAYLGGHWRRERNSNSLDGASFWYDIYETADGRYVSIGSLEPQFYELLIEKLGVGDDPAFSAQNDRERWPELKARIADLFRSKTRAEWCALMEGTDVCFAPVLDFEEAPLHPHNRARDTYLSVDGVRQPAPAPRFSKTPSKITSPPPAVGHDTESVLRAAGLSRDEIASLARDGVV